MPSVKKDKAAKAPSKSRKNTSQDASQEPQAPSAPKATIDDTIKVADSTIKADAPVKKSRKRVDATEDAAVTAGDAPVGKPSKKRKTAGTKSEKVSGTAAPADVHAEVEYEGHVIAAKKKGKDKGVANSEETSTAGRKVAKGKAAKATKNEEKDVAVAEGVGFPKEKPAAKKSAPKKGKASDMPSIEEGAMNLLEAAKDTAATAFKKGEAAIMGQAAAENKAKGKKRKAAEVAAPSDTVEVAEAAPVASKKKQKKGKSATEKVVESISDRVTTFLNTIGEAVGGKSIADDVVGVAEDAVETKAQEKKKVKGKTAGTKGKERADAAMTEDRAEDATAVAIVSVEEEDEWEPDDQTANLIRGFESDGEDDKDSGDEGFKEGKPVPKLPRRKGLSETLKDARSTNEPGVIYVGRIPHGFHEHQMRAYFTQFGTLNHVRLSRSKKTGRSKHYAFLEFASSEVAKIAADTMNNYLLFGHILKCSVVPKEQVHPNLWAGADKRFKAVPWARIEGRKLELPQGVTVWDKRVENERKRRKVKAEKVKEIMGYDVNMPALLGTESVPIKERNVKDKKLEAPKEAEAVKGEEVEGKIVVMTEDAKDGVITVSEEVTTKKSKDKDEKTAGKKEDKASKKKEKKEKKAVEEGEKTAGKMEDKATRKKEKKAVEGEKTAEKAEEQQKVSGKQEAKASKPKKEKKESKAPKPKKDKKAVRAASGAVETPKPANETKETTTDGPSSKRTPKPSKRALEAQESEASSARKPKKAKS